MSDILIFYTQKTCINVIQALLKRRTIEWKSGFLETKGCLFSCTEPTALKLMASTDAASLSEKEIQQSPG